MTIWKIKTMKMDTVKNADDKPFSLKQGTKNHV